VLLSLKKYKKKISVIMLIAHKKITNYSMLR